MSLQFISTELSNALQKNTQLFNNIIERRCINNCCIFKLLDIPLQIPDYKPHVLKVGALITDPKSNKILLVKGKYTDIWGISKGSIEPNETIESGVIREVLEETGILLYPEELTDKIIDTKKEQIFYVERNESVLEPCDVNDAVGIGWIKLECLTLMLTDYKISINNITRKILSRMYGIHVK